MIYNYTPRIFEAVVHDHIGQRFVPSVIYYDSDFQAYDLLVSMPFYFGEGDGLRPYGGFYIGPLVAWMVDRLPVKQSAIRGGFDAGYSWP